jgi:alanine dehydrogenase
VPARSPERLIAGLDETNACEHELGRATEMEGKMLAALHVGRSLDKEQAVVVKRAPEQREIDTSVVARASVIVADVVEEVAHDTGDMLAARRSGIDFEPRLIALADAIADPTRVLKYDGLRIYKSVGAALQDLTIAAMCVARARESAFGTELPAAIEPVIK